MPYPTKLSSARLRADFIDAIGNPDPCVLYIRAGQLNSVDQTIITTSVAQVEAVGGRLDSPIPLGDDLDLARPLVLEIEARFGGTPTHPRRPERYTVQVHAGDVENATEIIDGVSVTRPTVWLSKLIRIDGIPLITLGMVRSVDGIQPDAFGNVDLPPFLTTQSITDAVRGLATQQSVTDLGVTVGQKVNAAQVGTIITTRLADYTPTAALADLVTARVLAMLTNGPGISLSFDGSTGRLSITNTGGGGTTTPPDTSTPVGAFVPELLSTL